MASDNGTEITIGDVVDLQRGTTYKSALLGRPGPVLLGLASIARHGGFRRDSLRSYGGDSPENITLRSGDIYVSLKDVTQTCDLLGAVARVPTDISRGRLTQDTVKLVFKGPDVPPDYIYWLLRTPQYRDYCRSHATGTTTLGLPRDDFLSFTLPRVTPARLLVVGAIEALDKKIDRLRATNGRLMQLELISFRRLLARTAESSTRKTLGDLVTLEYGKPLKEANRRSGDIRVFGSGGQVGWHDEKLLNGPGIVVGRKGNAGAVTWAPSDFFVIDTAFYVMPTAEIRSLPFLFQTLSSIDFGVLNSDSAVPGLNRNLAYDREVSVPPLKDIETFDALARSLRSLHDLNEKTCDHLVAAQHLLLPKVVSGRVPGFHLAAALGSDADGKYGSLGGRRRNN